MPESVKIVIPATSLVNQALGPKDLSGHKFSRLLVQGYAFSDYRGRHWKCLCDCGKEVLILGKYLTGGDTKSCGCIRAEKEAGLGVPIKDLREHRSWHGAKSRCFNSKSKDYHRYGGRGITMCDRWRNSFRAFIEDMGFCPPGSTLERKDNNKGYDKENCIWATPLEQGRNKRNNIMVSIGGETRCVSEWLSHFGIKKGTYLSRLKSGWSRELALSTPRLTPISREDFEAEEKAD